MSTNTEQQWLDLLAGKTVEHAPQQLKTEAQIMREVLEDQYLPELNIPRQPQHKFLKKRFMKKAEQLGLFKASPWWQQPMVISGIAATFLVTLIGFKMLMLPTEQLVTNDFVTEKSLNKPKGYPLFIVRDNPESTVAQLRIILNKHQIQANIHQLKQRYEISATVPEQRRLELRADLKSIEIPIDPNGNIHIVIMKP